MKIFSERLKSSRLMQNLTQAEIADKLNIKQQSYFRYENDKGEPNLEILVKICEILGEDVAYLLGIKDY